MNTKQIDKMIEIINKNDLSELTVEENGVKITVRRGPITVVEGAAGGGISSRMAPRKTATHVSGETKSEDDALSVDYPAIKSPMVGTFYTGPSPDAEPFVTEGTVVEAGQAVCVIEAMKLMNEIVAEETGKIIKAMVKDGDPVEFGQALFYYEPSA
jgi:oxaloacetate decarboxylase alpha subunit